MEKKYKKERDQNLVSFALNLVNKNINLNVKKEKNTMIPPTPFHLV